MPFVTLYVNEKAELSTDNPLAMEALRLCIAKTLPGDLDPNADLDVNIVRRHRNAHSKYDMTISIDAMRTPERSRLLEGITAAIRELAERLFNQQLTINAWITLSEAGYAPMDS